MIKSKKSKPIIKFRPLRDQIYNTEEFTLKYLQSDFLNIQAFKERFKQSNQIGEGGQAIIKEAIDVVNHQNVALKIFNKRKMDFWLLEQAHREHQIIKNLKHPSILEYKGFFEDENHLCII